MDVIKPRRSKKSDRELLMESVDKIGYDLGLAPSELREMDKAEPNPMHDYIEATIAEMDEKHQAEMASEENRQGVDTSIPDRPDDIGVMAEDFATGGVMPHGLLFSTSQPPNLGVEAKPGKKKLSVQTVDPKDAALALRNEDDTMESLIIKGDLSRLTPSERVQHYQAVCKSLGLNYATHPFDYITFEGRNAKTVLYVNKTGTDQLRALRGVSITGLEEFYEEEESIYKIRAIARLQNGRTDISTGAVCLENLSGTDRANAIKRCETQAKRRVTLSIVGLGWMDESEAEATTGKFVRVDTETGEIMGG